METQRPNDQPPPRVEVAGWSDAPHLAPTGELGELALQIPFNDRLPPNPRGAFRG